MNYFLPMDAETGGLDPLETDMLTAYYSIFDEDWKLVEDIYLKLKPDNGRIPIAHAEALKVNGINIQEHMADPETITYSEAKGKVVSMIKKYLKKNGRYSNIRPLGQNVQFDVNYTNQYLIPKAEWNDLVSYRVIDTATITNFLKDCGWFPQDLGNLESIVKYLQLPMRPAHNAKEDTLMCVDVYKEMLKIMASKKDGGTAQDLISLLEAE